MFILLSLNYVTFKMASRVLPLLTWAKTKGREGTHFIYQTVSLLSSPVPRPAHTPSVNLGASSVHGYHALFLSGPWTLKTPSLPGSQYLNILKSQRSCHFFQAISSWPSLGGEAFYPVLLQNATFSVSIDNVSLTPYSPGYIGL